jgi:hypothetical protein
MKGERQRYSREEEILLTEKWVMVLQERGAGWGIHPADLVELIVMMIEVKELVEAVKSGGAAAECDKAFKRIERKVRFIKEQITNNK